MTDSTSQRYWGPFTGRQLTTIIVAVCASVVLIPGTVWAAPKIKSVFVQDPTNGARAGVDSSGRLNVGDGSGPLSIDGSVAVGGSVQEAQPADFYRTSDPIFANGPGCRQIAAAPAGKALIAKTIIVQQDVVNQAGQGYSIYRGTGCNDPNRSGVTGAPAVPGPTITLPFEPGLAVPSGQVLVVTQGNISPQFSVFGYTVAASACSTGCPEDSGIQMTCRDEVLVAAASVAARSPDATFTPAEVIAELRRRGTRYQESTIRTHVVSRMCINAAEYHATVYADLQRVGPGRYTLNRG